MNQISEPITIPKLEMHVTHACNLHCDGCSHYSNYGFTRGIGFEEFSDWLHCWKNRIVPQQLKLLGGEPSLLPNLIKYLAAAREIWPTTNLLLTTNGFFINRHPDLFAALIKYSCGVHFSLHSREIQYVEKIAKALETLEAVCRQNKLPFMFSTDQGWVRHYEGIGSDMRPYNDGDYQQSWQKCLSRTCLNLANNRLYKCPQLAYLPLVARKFNLHQVDEWKPYLTYEGLSHLSTYEELKSFLKRNDEAESCCGMCPVNPVPYDHDVYSTNFTQPGIKRVEKNGPVPF